MSAGLSAIMSISLFCNGDGGSLFFFIIHITLAVTLPLSSSALVKISPTAILVSKIAPQFSPLYNEERHSAPFIFVIATQKKVVLMIAPHNNLLPQ